MAHDIIGPCDIAIAAEAAGMTLVHYDHDFDAIQSVTGQPMRWVAPRAAL